jgi:hypothetical protein
MTEAQPKIGTGLIRSCVLLDTTRSREVDIEPLVEDIGYYENILSPTVSVHLNLRDGVNLKTDLPINGILHNIMCSRSFIEATIYGD